MTAKERNEHTNLVLLCPTHHKVVDSQPNTYGVTELKAMKAEHEERIRSNAERMRRVSEPNTSLEMESGSRPRFQVVLSGGSFSESRFAPEFTVSHLRGEPVSAVKWRIRGARFSMEWRQLSTALLSRTRLSEQFDLRNKPGTDDLVDVDQIGLHIRFHWRSRWRNELHRWPLKPDDLTYKTLWRMGDEVLPETTFDEDADQEWLAEQRT